MEFSNKLKEVQDRIGQAAARSGRSASLITLVAVTKTHPVEVVREAYGAGLRHFGENRVQEALPKIEALPSDIQWHLIGQLQTNKINKILGKFTLVHAVDSWDLAQALSARVGEDGQDILLEVNSSGEVSKAGVAPERALELAERVAGLPGLRLRGLMTVGPLTEDPGRQREAFKRLKGLFDEARGRNWAGKDFATLSMGMSGDFEIAIEEGSTLVRVGTALFGARG